MKIIYNKLINLAGLPCCPLSPCFPTKMVCLEFTQFWECKTLKALWAVTSVSVTLCTSLTKSFWLSWSYVETATVPAIPRITLKSGSTPEPFAWNLSRLKFMTQRDSLLPLKPDLIFLRWFSIAVSLLLRWSLPNLRLVLLRSLFGSHPSPWEPCCFTSKSLGTMLLYIHGEGTDYWGWGTQDAHLIFHTAPELWKLEIIIMLPLTETECFGSVSPHLHSSLWLSLWSFRVARCAVHIFIFFRRVSSFSSLKV